MGETFCMCCMSSVHRSQEARTKWLGIVADTLIADVTISPEFSVFACLLVTAWTWLLISVNKACQVYYRPCCNHSYRKHSGIVLSGVRYGVELFCSRRKPQTEAMRKVQGRGDSKLVSCLHWALMAIIQVAGRVVLHDEESETFGWKTVLNLYVVGRSEIGSLYDFSTKYGTDIDRYSKYPWQVLASVDDLPGSVMTCHPQKLRFTGQNTHGYPMDKPVTTRGLPGLVPCLNPLAH
jgi:hypothetical protein